MAFQNAIYQTLSNFGKAFVSAVDAAAARTQLEFTSTGSAVATAANPAAARTALELGTIAPQNANAVAITGGSATLTSLSSTTGTFTGSTASVNPQTGAVVIPNGGLGVGGNGNFGGSVYGSGLFAGRRLIREAVLSQSFFAVPEGETPTLVRQPVFERLIGANNKYTVTATNISNADRCFDGFSETWGSISAGQTAVIEIDLSPHYGGSLPNIRASVIEVGVYTSASTREPQSITIEAWTGSAWSVVGSATPAAIYPNRIPLLIEIAQTASPTSTSRLRITIVANASTSTLINGLSWYPGRINSLDGPREVLSSANLTQQIYGPGFEFKTISGKKTITGPSFVGLPSYTVSELNTGVSGQIAGAITYCTNESGGATPVFFDGTSWRRMTDRAVIS